MDVQALPFVLLPPANDKLLALLDDLDLIDCEACDSQSEAQPRSFRSKSGNSLYIEGGIAIGDRPSGPRKASLDRAEGEHEGRLRM